MPKEFKVTKDGAFKPRAEQAKVTTPRRYAAIEKDSGEVNVFVEPQPYFQKDVDTKEGERRVQYDADSGDLVDVPPTVEEVVNNVKAVADKATKVVNSDGEDGTRPSELEILSPEQVDALLSEYGDLLSKIPNMTQEQVAKAHKRMHAIIGALETQRSRLADEASDTRRQAERQNQQATAGNNSRHLETDDMKAAVEKAFNAEPTTAGKRKVFQTVRSIINGR